MTVSKRMAALAAVGVVALFALEFGERFSVPGVRGVVTAAEAVVGRPATPVSVAGVARRSVRRCAVGVYHC
ncbi:MAG: hypothetical protein IPK81_21475 [Rhodospirillales bacterium]|nr:MAG: hypothetical protein IPK81_21475 [Rhodospirillales bacterium]